MLYDFCLFVFFICLVSYLSVQYIGLDALVDNCTFNTIHLNITAAKIINSDSDNNFNKSNSRNRNGNVCSNNIKNLSKQEAQSHEDSMMLAQFKYVRSRSKHMVKCML